MKRLAIPIVAFLVSAAAVQAQTDITYLLWGSLVWAHGGDDALARNR
jgi:hypothetical protein